ncbi:MAG: hypothetical protein H6821_02735 [Planctomycetaceae bacterium]|nr:hypothetical protein [Planctomycetaceae bacterium]
MKFIRGNLADGELSVNADVVANQPDLCCVVIRFDEARNRGVRFTDAPKDDFGSRLAEFAARAAHVEHPTAAIADPLRR